MLEKSFALFHSYRHFTLASQLISTGKASTNLSVPFFRLTAFHRLRVQLLWQRPAEDPPGRPKTPFPPSKKDVPCHT